MFVYKQYAVQTRSIQNVFMRKYRNGLACRWLVLTTRAYDLEFLARVVMISFTPPYCTDCLDRLVPCPHSSLNQLLSHPQPGSQHRLACLYRAHLRTNISLSVGILPFGKLASLFKSAFLDRWGIVRTSWFQDANAGSLFRQVLPLQWSATSHPAALTSLVLLQINMISQWANLLSMGPAVKALPALATALTMMWVMRKIRHPAALPVFLITVPLVFHAVLLIQGLTLAEAADAGWVSHPTVSPLKPSGHNFNCCKCCFCAHALSPLTPAGHCRHCYQRYIHAHDL